MPNLPPRLPVKNKTAREKTGDRGYGHEHQRARREKLRACPVCEFCQAAIATDVHHIDRDPFNRDPRNLFAVCEVCHHGILHGKHAEYLHLARQLGLRAPSSDS